MIHLEILILLAAIAFNYASPIKEDASDARLQETFQEDRGKAARQSIRDIRRIYNSLQRTLQPSLQQVMYNSMIAMFCDCPRVHVLM